MVADLLDGVTGVLRTLDPRSAEAPGDADGPGPEARGRGTDGDGQVVALVDGAGRVVGLDLPPRATRLPSPELAERVVAAVNGALADRGFAATGDDASAADLEDLRQRVWDLRERSLAHMRSYTRALADIMTTIQDP